MGSTTDKESGKEPGSENRKAGGPGGKERESKAFRPAEFIRSYWIALRVFSLSLAVGGAGFGLIAAWYRGELFSEGRFDGWLLVLLVMIAGLCSQAGANLINDYFEGSFKYPDSSQRTMHFLGRRRTRFDVFVFLSGLGVLGLAGLIGLYLVWRTDYVMLIIGLAGIIGSYAYTGEPFVYKRRGLGVPLSFLLMGPLMNLGAWYAVTAAYVAAGFYPPAALAVWLTLPLAVGGHMRVIGHHSRSIPATNQLHLFFITILNCWGRYFVIRQFSTGAGLEPATSGL